MSELYWTQAYRNLAERLLDFYKRNEGVAGILLFSLCEKPEAKELLQFIDRFKKSGNNPSLDPVNIFASFSGQLTPTGLRLLRYNFLMETLCGYLGLPYEQVTGIDFEGCPMPRTTTILQSRMLQHQEQIWYLFSQIMQKGQMGLTSAAFDNLKFWPGLQVPSLTIFLFWIDSEHFLPLDNNTVSYLRSLSLLDSRSVDYQTYRQLLSSTEGADYVQMSKEAYYYKNAVPPESRIAEQIQETTEPFPPKPTAEKIAFERALQSRIGEFKIVALKVYDGTDPKWLRVLAEDHFYQLSHAYDLSNDDFVKYDPAKDLRLYNVQGMSISVSAIVGKNGSGKSSLVDLIYIILNNLSERHPGIIDEMIYVPDVYMDFYYAAEEFYKIELRGEQMAIRRYIAADGGYRYKSTMTVPEFPLPDLFYTISLNYAHFSLNSNHIGNWINHLFHKNDAYQQPLVLNPHRNEGNIDVNEEENLANSRLLANLLFYDPDPGAAEKIATFRELTDKQQAEEIELKLDEKKLEFLFVINAPTPKEPERKLYGQWKDVQPIWKEFIEAVNEVFKIPFSTVDTNPVVTSNWTSTAYKYLLRKSVTIALKYRKYKGEYWRTKHNFKAVKAYLERLKNDDSHITYKFKQAINFLKYEHLKPYLNDRPLQYKVRVPVHELSLSIYDTIIDNASANLSTMLMIPPAFLKPDVLATGEVKLSGLSSGEKQRIFAASTIGYHLINIDSGNTDQVQVRYKFVNIIFDEIELYYHPEMQRTFVDYLLRYISYLPLELAGLNITFITHSPFILSDIPADNIAFLGGEASAWKTFGANIHDMLADSFFLKKGVMGDYVKGTIISLSAFLNGREDNSDFKWTRESAANVIKIIGEPVIRKQLESLWIKKFEAVDRRAKIESLKLEMQRLQDEEDRQQ